METFSQDTTTFRFDSILHGRGLTSLERTIDKLFELSNNSASELFLLQIVNDWLSKKDALRSILNQILECPRRSQWSQSESSKNPNGFYRLMLLSGARFKCRVHIWTEEKFGTESIHDHKCNFASRILKGGYTNMVYRENTGRLLHDSQVYLIDTNDPNREARIARSGSVELESITHFREKSSFVFPNHVLHKLLDVSPFTLTMTTRGLAQNKSCRVFHEGECPLARPEIGLNDETFHSLLRQIKMQYLYDN